VHFVTRIQVLLLVLLASVALSQGIPRAGTRFTFAIPEGADNVTIIRTPSRIILNVISAHDGEGVVWSPNGTMISFTFKANQVKIVNLPYELILLHDLGKSAKGIIVRTTQPVNLTMHNVLDYAGEATQIWPDAALGTDYLVPGWGLWNDVGENNRTQITVVASENNTTVTVTPTVDCIGGEKKDVPSVMTLQRGECYVIKADTSGEPRRLSLFRSKVSSDKPVSVLSSTTCAYAPLETQACNEILDHLLPYTNIGTEFYVSTPSEVGHKCRILFISETPSFFVFAAGGPTAFASGGRAELSLTDPTLFRTSVPVQCYLVTDGYASHYVSDPSIVTVLPADQYTNDLTWYAPRILSDSSPLINFVSVIYPTANENDVFLDSDPVGLYPNRAAIPGSSMSAAMIAIKEGMHRITSPVPVLGTAYGFLPADAYSFVIMGTGPRIDIDTPDFSVKTLLQNPMTCEVFDGTIALDQGIEATENIYRLRLTLTYDPTAMDLVNVAPTGFLTGLTVTIDTSTPGTIIVDVLSDPDPIVGAGDMLTISFFGKRAGATPISSEVSASQLEFAHLESAHFTGTETITLDESRSTAQVSMSVAIEDVTVGEPTLAHIILNDAVAGVYSEVRIRLSYDHDLLDLVEVVDPSTQLLGWNRTVQRIDFETDEYIFTPSGSGYLQGPGTLMRFRFESWLTRDDTTTFRTSGTFTSADPCPTDLLGQQGAALFRVLDTCGTPTIRSLLKSAPFEFLEITPNPTTGSVDAFIRHWLQVGDVMKILLADMTGKKLWTTTLALSTAPEAHLLIDFPTWIASGSYMLTLEAAGYAVSRQVLLNR
jgi:hypothetical protein